MAANKTVETDLSVTVFVRDIADAAQRAAAQTLTALLTQATGYTPKMWGPSIIGFGTRRYRYESGREGEICRIGFSPRKGETVLYGMGVQNHPEILAHWESTKPVGDVSISNASATSTLTCWRNWLWPRSSIRNSASHETGCVRSPRNPGQVSSSVVPRRWKCAPEFLLELVRRSIARNGCRMQSQSE